MCFPFHPRCHGCAHGQYHFKLLQSNSTRICLLEPTVKQHKLSQKWKEANPKPLIRQQKQTSLFRVSQNSVGIFTVHVNFQKLIYLLILKQRYPVDLLRPRLYAYSPRVHFRKCTLQASHLIEKNVHVERIYFKIIKTYIVRR